MLFPKQVRVRNPKYLAFVRKKPCVVCGSRPVEAHHLLRADGTKGMGLKSGDQYAVPLCSVHHSQLHNMGNEASFFKLYGKNLAKTVEAAAATYELWINSFKK